MATKQSAYQKWYEANKDEFNRRRRARYKKDPAVQAAAIKQAAKYRKENPRQPSEPKHYRTVNGNSVEVFRIGAASEMVGRSEQMIRIWERDGKIPRPTVKSKHRYYTMSQVKLMREFSELMDQIRYDQTIRNLGIEKKSAEIHALWES